MPTVRVLLLSLALAACAGSRGDAPGTGPEGGATLGQARSTPLADATPTQAPAWAKAAVWYQIFPERFWNGDRANDPTPESMTGSWPQVGADSLRAAGWAVTPWTHDWYAREAWAERLRPGDFWFGAQLRRYGGDLQGILDRLDHVQATGATAIYLNPTNWSPSLHKYDAMSYVHVDPHFGPDPEGDKARIAAEAFDDPETWAWTAADRLMLELIEAVHARGMRVVLDFSWNHTGTQHPAFQSVLAQGQASPYADWYRIDAWDDPATDADEFAYTGWAGVPELPELRKTGLTGSPHDGVPYDGNLDDEVRDHVFAVTRRWLDPDGDGDPSDGVDGFRLDVAEMVPLGFWRDYRRVVKAVNPEAVLIGEIWWQQWPDVMMDPALYLDVFDSVMHYRPFKPLRALVAPGGGLAPGAFVAEIDSVYADVPADRWAALMTMSGSHDTPRLATTLHNPEVDYKHEETPRNTPGYRIDRPGDDVWRAVRLFRLAQIALPGAPHVYYGDEVGMWGADDPDPRKPMLWPGLDYADETATPTGTRPADPVAPDAELQAWTAALLQTYRAHPDVFARGTFRATADDAAGLVLLSRLAPDGERRALVVLNLADGPRTVRVDGAEPAHAAGPAPEPSNAGWTLAPRSGALFLTE